MFTVKDGDQLYQFTFQHLSWYRDAWNLEAYEALKDLVGRNRQAVTTCRLRIGDHTYVGKAMCSWDDHFCKETGRRLALERAVATSGVSKQIRGKIWARYATRGISDNQLGITKEIPSDTQSIVQ